MADKESKDDKARRRREKREQKRAARVARRKASGGLLAPAVNRKETYKRLLVVCEGARTEPLYFQRFPVRNGDVVTIEGLGMNTLSLVQQAVRLRDEDGHYDEVWAVFDRDSFPSARFNSALSLAARENVAAAWTNEAFELWYLLHFEYCEAGLSRTTYSKRLSRHLKRPYTKNDPTMYSCLLSRQPEALRNASRLRQELAGTSAVNRNPATEVDRLVLRLNALQRR